MYYWAATNKDRTTYLYKNCPHRESTGWYSSGPSMNIDSDLFPDLTWESDPIKVELKRVPKVIVLTKYYDDPRAKHDWFIQMLRGQKKYPEEKLEDIWEQHCHLEIYTDEIKNMIQCDGYTKILLQDGEFIRVSETKEWIQNRGK